MKSVYHATQVWAEQRSLSVVAFDETPSTNDEAKNEASDLAEEPRLYLAGHQTKGRGRGKNQWLDTGAGESLLSSWSFHLEKPPQSITGPRIGDALYRSVETTWPTLDWSVKAPNDLYLGANKIGGLLVETVSQGSFHRLIIGLGLNILNHPRTIANATHFVAPGSEQAITEDEWYRFLDALLGQFKQALADITHPHLSREIRTSLLKALNAFPGKKDAFVDVGPNGDLITQTKTIPWTQQ